MNIRSSGRSRSGSRGVQWTLSGSVASRSRSWSSNRIRAERSVFARSQLDQPRISGWIPTTSGRSLGQDQAGGPEERPLDRRPAPRIATQARPAASAPRRRPPTHRASHPESPTTAEAAGTASRNWNATRNRSGSRVLVGPQKLPNPVRSDQRDDRPAERRRRRPPTARTTRPTSPRQSPGPAGPAPVRPSTDGWPGSSRPGTAASRSS